MQNKVITDHRFIINKPAKRQDFKDSHHKKRNDNYIHDRGVR